MKKFIDFFVKHKKTFIISLCIVLLAAVSLTAVTIALWNSEEEHSEIVTEPTNPAVKYLQYFVAVENASSECGFDYYPTTRVPSAFKDRIAGLAVARYDGFASTVEIPQNAFVDLIVDGTTYRDLSYTVIHILSNYSETIGNGFSRSVLFNEEEVNNFVDNIVLPSTITYVHEGAFDSNDTIYVKGGITYTYLIETTEEEVKITTNEGIVDTLVKRDGYYLSATTYTRHEYDGSKITYISKIDRIKEGKFIENNYVKRVYGLDSYSNVTYEDKLNRENNATYSLTKASLFSEIDGVMISDGGSNYHTYVVTGANGTTLSIDNKSINLEDKHSKYYVTYNNGRLERTKVTYSVGGTQLTLDDSNTNYESYVADITLNGSDISVSCSDGSSYLLSNPNKLTGIYELTFAPDTLFTDLENRTLHSFDEIYYIHDVNEKLELVESKYLVTVDPTESSLTIFTATNYSGNSIEGETLIYTNAFKLPDTSLTYYASYNGGVKELLCFEGLYYADLGNSGSVKIYGYKNGYEEYVSPVFTYTSGKIYDLVSNDGSLMLDVISLDINENYFTIKSAVGLSYITLDVTYTDYTSTYTLSERVNLSLTQGVYKVSSTDIAKVNSILAVDNIFSNEYRIDSYMITTNNGVVLYEYSYSPEDGRLPSFYQKQYELFKLKSSNITSKVHFDYSKLDDGNTSFNVSSNKLEAIKTSKEYTYTINSSERMNRNFANTSFAEYYASAQEGKHYIVNKNNNSVSVVDKLASYYASVDGILLYTPNGYSSTKYYLYTLDGMYVDTLVYQDGLLYTNVFDMGSYNGYYVTDSNGNVYNSYKDLGDEFKQLYDYYIVSDKEYSNILEGKKFIPTAKALNEINPLSQSEIKEGYRKEYEYEKLTDGITGDVVNGRFSTGISCFMDATVDLGGTYALSNLDLHIYGNSGNFTNYVGHEFYVYTYLNGIWTLSASYTRSNVNEFVIDSTNKIVRLNLDDVLASKVRIYSIYKKQTYESNGTTYYYVTAINEIECYGYPSTNSGLDLVNGYGLLKSNDGTYVINNAYLPTGTYYINNAVSNLVMFNIPTDGYYNVSYDSNSVNVNESNPTQELTGSVVVDSTNYKLYPTNNSSIYSNFIAVNNDNSNVNIYDTSNNLVTTVKLNKGTYRIYVNLSSNNINTFYGWRDRIYIEECSNNQSGVLTENILEFNPYDNKLSVNNSKVITSEIDNVMSSYKLQTSTHTVNGIVMKEAGDDYYEVIVKVNDSIILDDNAASIDNLIPGTYLVQYINGVLSYYRIEGSKQYYVIINNHKYGMILNTSTNLYEEYKTERSYSISSDFTIEVVDDLNNTVLSTSFTKPGLYELLFSVDNVRRYNNNYDVFVNLKGIEVESKEVVLHGENESAVYYYSMDNTNLPEFSDYFSLDDGMVFSHWSLTSNGSKLNDLSSYPTNIYAVIVKDCYVIENSNDYFITDLNGNKVTKFEYTKNSSISFKVQLANEKYKILEVSVGDKILSANGSGVYSFNCNDIDVASIKVVLEYPQASYKNVTINLNTNGGSLSEGSFTYKVGTYAQLPKPSLKGYSFLYYFDTNTGMVYTDGNGNLLSPYMITKDITLTACYTNSYYVIMNIFDSKGNLLRSDAEMVSAGSLYKGTFIRDERYHYSEIKSVKTTNGYPVEFVINEYEHLYSFTMPSANVVINVIYDDAEVINRVDNQSDTIYILIPSSFAYDAKIYNASGYMELDRLSAEYQIYPGFVAYKFIGFNCDKIKVMANGDYSYAYPYDGNENLYIIDNFSLENEIVYPYKWLEYTPNENVFTLNNYTIGNDVVVNSIHGEVMATGNTVTILKAINSSSEYSYQYAAFELVVTSNPIKISFMVYYYADGKSNPILINDNEDFKDYVGNGSVKYLSGLKFKQTANINVSDMDGYDVVFNEKYPFNHTYNGDGMEISYVQNKFRTGKNNGLFGYIGKNGLVKNLTIDYDLESTNYENGHDAQYYIGSIAGYNAGKVDKVTTKENTIVGYNLRYVGGIVGYNEGYIENCTNNISFTIRNYGVSDSYCIGGICGFSYALNTSNIINNGTIDVENASNRSTNVTEINRGLVVDNTMFITFADDSYFESSEMTLDGQTYKFENVCKVTYYNGSTNLGYIIYGKEQLDINKTIQIALLDNTTKIVVSRVTLITNDSEGYERFYYSYSSNNGFDRLRDSNNKPYGEYVGFPNETNPITITNLTSYTIGTNNNLEPFAEKISNIEDYSERINLDYNGNTSIRIYYYTIDKTYYYDVTSGNTEIPYVSGVNNLKVTEISGGVELNSYGIDEVHANKTLNITLDNNTFSYYWIDNSYIIKLSVDDNVMMWNSYYVLVNGNYYLMKKVGTRSFEATIYEDYSNSNVVLTLTSNPDLLDSCQMTLPYQSNNTYEINSISSSYYLYGSMNNYKEDDSNYYMYSYNDKHYGFLDLSEEATIKISNTSFEFTLGAGLHMVMYDGSKYVVYSDKQAFNVSFVNGDETVFYGYSLGATIKYSGETPLMAETDKFSYEFIGWSYNGKLYNVKNNFLYDSDGNVLKVTDNISLIATFESKIKEYTLKIVNIINGDEYLLDNIKFACGTMIPLTVLKTNSYVVNNSGLKDRWFIDWYVDDLCTVKLVDKLVIDKDMTIYALWSKDGAYLVGKINGYTTLAPRNEFELDSVSTSTTDYQIEGVFLEKDDSIKVLYNTNGNASYPTKWSVNGSSFSGNVLNISETGYYSFYFDKDQMMVVVKFIKYVVHFDGNGYNTTFDSYYFNASANEPFELYTLSDKMADVTVSINTPDIINLDSNMVLYGWFDKEGNRITKITPNMLDNHNSITLYADYKTKGYYINGLADSNICTLKDGTFNLSNTTAYTSGQTFNVYYFDGSINGSYCVFDNIKGSNNIIISEKVDDLLGRYLTITIATAGNYLIYEKQGYLFIDQYHEVTYNFDSKLTSINSHVVNDKLYHLLYQTSLVTLNVNETTATFVGWKEENTGLNRYPYVIKNADYIAVYVIGENIKPSIDKADYIVNYYIDGKLYGIGSISGGENVLLPTITMSGKNVVWHTDPNYTNSVTTITATGDLNLYGLSGLVTYYTYYIQCKTPSGDVISVQKVTKEQGSTHIINAPEVLGYKSTESEEVTFDSANAKTITFTYTPISYTIKFNANTGSGSMADLAMTYDLTKEITANTFNKTGYLFAGWNTKPDGSGVSYSNNESIKNLVSIDGATINLYAMWTPVKYSVKFNANGGSGSMSNQSFTYDKSLNLTANAFSRTGYTFAGWATSATGSKVYDDKQSVSNLASTQDAVFNLYAVWTPITYTITYNLNGGSVSGNPSTYTIETASFTLINPTRNGYTFAGWTGTNGNTPQTTVTISNGSIGDREYTAVWTAITYTITYNLNGGSVSGNPSTYTIETDSFTLINPTKRGYVFVGWTGTNVSTAQSSVTIAKGSIGNREYIAVWTESTDTPYKVEHYYMNLNGDYNGVTPTIQNLHGTTGASVTPTVIETTGFTSPSTQTVSIAADGSTVVQYYYTRNRYTFDVNYKLDGNSSIAYADLANIGKFSITVDGKDSKTNVSDCYYEENASKESQGVYYGASYSITGINAMPGYTHSGNDALTGTVTGLTIVYIEWTANTYTVKFNGNGNTGGSMNNQSLTYGIPQNLTANGYSRTGYTFAGWATSVDGSKAYDNQASVKNLTSTNGATYNLYAVWTPNTNTVYKVNHHQMNLDGSTYKLHETVSRTGTSDSSVTFENLIKTYTGFTYKEGKVGGNVVTTTTILADGTRVIDLYYTRNKVTFDINFRVGDLMLNNETTPKYYEVGTFDLYINGSLVASGVSDYRNDEIYYGTPYEITNVKAKPGYHYEKTKTDHEGLVGYATEDYHDPIIWWRPNNYTIEFNANGGSGTTASMSMTYGTAKNLTANGYSRTGYTFAGWAESKGGSKAYGDKQSVNIATTSNNATVTLYAVWTANTYTVKFNGNGNTGGSMNNQSFTYDVSQNLTANGYSRTGYTFAGWATSADGSKAYDNQASVKNLTSTNGATYNLYAVWTPNTNTVYKVEHYQMNLDGSTYTKYETQTLTGTTASSVTPAVKSYTGFTSPSTQTVTIAADGSTVVKYYYTRNRYQFDVNYYLDGKYVEYTAAFNNYHIATFDIEITGKDKQTGVNDCWYPSGSTPDDSGKIGVFYGATYKITNITTKPGYTYSGATIITGQASISGDNLSLGSGDKALCSYIRIDFTTNKYTVTWKNHDGTVLETDTNLTYGTTPTYNGATPTKAGNAQYSYTFTGWSPAISAVTGNVIYTAQFSSSVNNYTITWNPNGGKWSDNTTGNKTTTVAYGSTPTVPTTLTRNGYTLSWNPTISAVTGAKTYTAVWTPITYSVKFNANGGSGSMSNQTFTYDVSQNLTANSFRRDYYTFLGWSKDKNATAATYTNMQSVKNLTNKNETVTLYAIWRQNTVTVIYDPYTMIQSSNIGSIKLYGSNTEYKNSNVNTFNQALQTFYANKLAGGGQWAYNPTVFNAISEASGNHNGTYGLINSYNSTTEVIFTSGKTGYRFASGWTIDTNESFFINQEPAAQSAYDPTFNGTFNGQYLAKVCGKTEELKNGDITITLYTYLIAVNYKIAFNNNGGSGTMSTISTNYGANVILKNTFTKANHTFIGWSRDKNATTATYTNNQTVNNLSTTQDEIVTLYAIWKPNYVVNHYQMTLEGTYPSTPTETQTMYGNSGTSLTLGNLAKTYTGFTYKEGKVGNSVVTTTTILANGTQVINLYYSRNRYTIDVNYTLDGVSIYNSATDTTPAANTVGTFNITVTGKDSATNVTDYYRQEDAANGIHNGVYYGATYTITNITPKAGYSYSGGTITGTIGARNAYINIPFNANTYTIVFNANGGSGTMNNQSMKYATATALNANTYTRTGYMFAGWNTNANGTGTAYADKTSVQKLIASGTITLYAQWVETVSRQGNAWDDPGSANTRAATYIKVPLKAGTTITFTGDTNTYKWAVAQSNSTNPNSAGGNALDSGWNTANGVDWNGTNTTYITTGVGSDGTTEALYIYLTIARIDGGTVFTSDEAAKAMNSWFTIFEPS